MELLVVGLSHRTAPVAVRERLALVPSEIEPRLKLLISLPGVAESMLISTCNRVEIYAAGADGAEVAAVLRDHLRLALDDPRPDGAAQGIDSFELDRHLYQRTGRAAVHHLFRVAASLDSLVVGEPQILGQVKDAFDTALRAQTVGPVLGAAFQRAFRVARKVRRDTSIARNPVSVSSVAVELARQVWSGFEGRRVLLVGAGKMADLAARSLRSNGASVAVTNRTLARAEEVAARLGCEVEPFSGLLEALQRADIVIASTGSREPILRYALMADVQRVRRGRPLVIIDIAVPRDAEAEVGQLEGVFLYDVDDLQNVAAQHLAGRRSEADRAETMVEEELARYLADHRGRAVGPTIAALRARYLSVARAEIEKILGTLPGLDDRSRRTFVEGAEAIVAKLLHAPQVALKKGLASDEGEGLLSAAHVLFDLPAVEPLEAEAQGSPGEQDDAKAEAQEEAQDKAEGAPLLSQKAIRS